MRHRMACSLPRRRRGLLHDDHQGPGRLKVPQRSKNSTRPRLASDALPHLKPGVLIHILINKIDEEIESHTDYRALAEELAKKLAALDETAINVLHPYEAVYTGATLISMKNKQIYTRAINNVLRSVYAAFHGTAKRQKAR